MKASFGSIIQSQNKVIFVYHLVMKPALMISGYLGENYLEVIQKVYWM